MLLVRSVFRRHQSQQFILLSAHSRAWPAHRRRARAALAYVDFKALRTLELGPGKRTAVDVSAMFWHFIDGLWVYLMALFSRLGVICRCPEVNTAVAIPASCVGRWTLAIRRQFQEVRDVAVHHLGCADVLRAADGVHVLAIHIRIRTGLRRFTFLPSIIFSTVMTLLPAFEQFDHGRWASMP